MILVIYFAIMIYCIIRYTYWMLLSKYGNDRIVFDLSNLFLEIFIMTMYLTIINMMAQGYQIMSFSFTFKPFIKNVIIGSFILITQLLMTFANFFLMIFMVVEIIILILVLKMDISSNITKLKEVLRNQDNFIVRDPDYVSVVEFKIKYYKVFKIYLYVYWGLECLVMFIRPFFVLYHEWIFTLLHQILILISMSFLFITLNYTIRKTEEENVVEVLHFPLPFDPKKDPKIIGSIVVIHNVCEQT